MNKRVFDFALTAISIGLASSLLLGTTGAQVCNAAPARGVSSSDIEKKGAGMPVKLTDVVSSTEAFGLDLYQKLCDRQPDANCFISPASIAICLSMGAAGAAGATHDAMAKGLHLPAGDASAAFGELLNALESEDQKVQMKIANAIFVNDKMPLNPSYASGVGKHFKSEIRNENFSDSAGTTKKINGWCSDKTNGHITSIINGVSTNDLAVLLNAIYFKGKWTTPFPATATADGDFEQPGGSPLKVKLMSRTGKFEYFAEKDFQAVQLPYGSQRFQAIVFLPRKGLKLDALRKQVTSSNWDRWMNQFSPYVHSRVDLPRFHIDYSKQLNESLTALGFGKMFSSDADFSKMHTPPPGVKVSSVIHKTTLDVDEEGTVATAVTGMVMTAMAAVHREPDKTFVMIVDRPFVFAIRDTQTGALLFIGSVNKPENKVDMR